MQQRIDTKSHSGSHSGTRIHLVLTGVAVLMFGFAFALVPLYDTLCRALGINGKIEQAEHAGQRHHGVDLLLELAERRGDGGFSRIDAAARQGHLFFRKLKLRKALKTGIEHLGQAFENAKHVAGQDGADDRAHAAALGAAGKARVQALCDGPARAAELLAVWREAAGLAP